MNRAGLATGLFAAVAALATPVAVAAPNGMAVLLAAGGVGIALLGPSHLRLANVAAGPKLIVALFLALALASLFWTLDAAEGFDGWVRIAIAASLGFVWIDKAAGLDEAARRRVEKSLLVGFCLSLAFLSAQIVSAWLWTWEGSLASLWMPDYTNFYALYNRSATVIVMLLPLATVAAWRLYARPAAIAVGLLGAFVVVQLNSKAAELGLFAGLACLGAYVVGPVAGRRILAAALAGALLASPFLAASPQLAKLAERRDISVSIYHRAAIWGFAAERIAEKPLFGWGMHAARTMPKTESPLAAAADLMPLHPHNGALHLWLEFGLAGALLGAALLAWLALTAAAWPQAALLASAVAVASVGYGLWQGWWMAALWLVAGLGAASRRP